MNTSSLLRIRAARGHSAIDCSARSSWSAGTGSGLDHGVILVVEIEQVRGNSHAHGVALAAITVDFHSHRQTSSPGFSLENTTRLIGTSVTPAWTLRLERVTTGCEQLGQTTGPYVTRS